jgi:hypothetical protein
VASVKFGVINYREEYCRNASCSQFEVTAGGFRDDILSSAYASNLEPLILQYQPQYRIHGHIHTTIKYEVGSTKVICNPNGYIDEPYNGFEKNLIIEI